jgi:hypothetical protein
MREGYTYRHTDWWKGAMKGSGAIIYEYIKNIMKTGSSIQKLVGGYRNTDTKVITNVHFHFFFKIRKVG